MPLGPARGIILHYLQTTFNQPFDLPLGSRTGGRMALVSGSRDRPGGAGFSEP